VSRRCQFPLGPCRCRQRWCEHVARQYELLAVHCLDQLLSWGGYMDLAERLRYRRSAIRAWACVRPPLWRPWLLAQWWWLGRKHGLLGPAERFAAQPERKVEMHTEGPYR
jgi:hypothetical protein